MRLLHVIATTDQESGGPIEALVRISEVLIRDGHEVAVVSLEDADDVATRGFPFPVVGLGRGTRKYSYNSRLTTWLHDNSRSFDAIVLHGLWNYSSLGAWRALRNGPAPYFIFAHGMMDPWFKEQYPLKHMLKQIYWTAAEGRVLRDAKAVLFTCEEERLRAAGAFKGHSYRERVVLFGTADPDGNAEAEIAAFNAAFPALQNRKYLLFLSRIHPKKGCDLLLQAFGDLVRELPEDLDLVIAGPDQVGWSTELRAVGDRLGISNRLHWPGMLKGDVKWGAFRNAEALMLPSHQENFGFVVAEAMACSTAVLISNKVNIWREVSEVHAGFVEPDTLEGTRNLIKRFQALSAQDRQRMSQNARNGFLKYFDVQVTARDFAKAIGFEWKTPSDSEVAIAVAGNEPGRRDAR
jgi:glycosyltransferase involved in cell wall biosynthesis